MRIHAVRLLHTDLKDVVAKRIEQVICHDANGVHASSRPKFHPRAAELDGRVMHGVKYGHVQLARLQERFQDLHHQRTKKFVGREGIHQRETEFGTRHTCACRQPASRAVDREDTFLSAAAPMSCDHCHI